MKIILYSSIFFALFILYLGTMIMYVPIASTIITIAGLAILGLLFYEIYKKYRFSPRAKYMLIFFVIFWAALFISQIEYIPSKEILVKDVFGKSIENISITLNDDVGSKFGGHGGSLTRIPKVFHYITDSQGRVETKARFYFGQRKAKSTSVVINSDVYKIENGYRGDLTTRANSQFNVKFLTVYDKYEHGNKYEVYLSPFKVDYQTCNSISDQKRKSECLVYGLFYSAVKEKNYHLCEAYDDEGVNQAYGGRPFELKYECMILVEGAFNNNPNICNQIEDKETRYFDQQCKVIFSDWENNPENCDPSYKDKCKEIRVQFLSDTHNFLCAKNNTALGNPFGFQTSVPIYKEMFCQ